MTKLLQCFNPVCRKSESTHRSADGRIRSPGPSDDWVELTIVEEKDDIFLLCLYSNGFLADTWHESVEEAKEYAFGYGIEENAWQICHGDDE